VKGFRGVKRRKKRMKKGGGKFKVMVIDMRRVKESEKRSMKSQEGRVNPKMSNPMCTDWIPLPYKFHAKIRVQGPVGVRSHWSHLASTRTRRN
jgi:hypothetical protein